MSGGRADFVLVPPASSEEWTQNPRLPAKVKTVQIYASENDIQEAGRANMRRPKLQGYVAPECHPQRHICTVLSFAGTPGFRAHGSSFHVNPGFPKTPAVDYVPVTSWPPRDPFPPAYNPKGPKDPIIRYLGLG